MGSPISCQPGIQSPECYSTSEEATKVVSEILDMAKSLLNGSGKKMDDLLRHLLAFPPHPPPIQPLADEEYEDRVLKLIYTLKTTPAKVLASGTSGGGDLLDVS